MEDKTEQNKQVRQSNYQRRIGGLVYLYTEENLSLKEIGERESLHPDTVSRWLKKSGVRIKTSQERRTPEQQQEIIQKISKSKAGVKWNEKQHQARVEQVQSNDKYHRFCPCGKEVARKLTPNGKSNWNKYCSNKCRETYRTYTKLPRLCLCGNTITRYMTPNGIPRWNKYCSNECKRIYGTYPKGKTKSAICIGCGLEFTRPASYPSAMKYCSNKCSHHEVKSVRDKFIADLNDKAIVFHSMWEMRFAVACDKHNIPWRRYDGPDIETPLGNHRPDFIVGPEDNENIVEIKGQFDYEDLIKTEKVKEIYGRKYSLLFEEELKYFEETGILFIASPDVPLDIVEHFKAELKSIQDYNSD